MAKIPKPVDKKKDIQKKTEFGMDLLKRAKAGKITQAEMNMEVKELVKANYESALKNFMNQ